jgi:hypothetical protein
MPAASMPVTTAATAPAAAHAASGTAPRGAQGGSGVHKGYITALNHEGFTIDQCIGDLAVGRFDDPAEGRARDIHAYSGIRLVEAFAIGQPHSFDFIERERHLFKVGSGHAARFEEGSGRLMPNNAL